MINTDLLVYQAKSFYNAFIALEQLNQTCEDHFMYRIPMFVNGAFSIEITLKAILANNQIDFEKEHNLLVLFQKMPDSFQSELLNHLFGRAPEYRDAQKCMDELILISNVFVDWRYAFEGNPVPAFDIRFLSVFANAAICTMFSHYNVNIVPASDDTKTDEEIEQMIRQNRETCKNNNLHKIQKKRKEHQA